MAVSAVQHRSQFATGAISLALAFASNNAAGNLLVYGTTGSGNSTTSPVAATDSNTNTIANATSSFDVTGGSTRIDYVASSHSGANTVTGHLSSSTSDIHLHIWEISGCLTVSPLRDTGLTNGSATGSVSTTGTSTLTGDAVLALFRDDPANNTLVKDAGYSLSESTQNATGGDASLSEFKVATAGGTQTATCTGNGTNKMSQTIATFKAAAASTPSITGWGQSGDWDPGLPSGNCVSY